MGAQERDTPDAGDTGATTADADELRRLVETQAEVVAAQALLIGQMADRLDRLEGAGKPSAPPNDGPSTPVSSGLDVPTSRRNLMTKGAAAAATAVIGTAAVGLATASPAAAASGSFTGSPAVTATGTGAGMTRGVLGTSVSTQGGIGVEGNNSATVGSTYGVRGEISTTGSGAGVVGEAVGQTGSTVGVYGISRSSSEDSAGVFGEGSGVFGPTIGVRGQTYSPDGTAVVAAANAGGIAVKATSDKTQLFLAGNPVAPQGAGKARIKGEMVFDANADLWLCAASGTPGLWRKITGRSAAGSFHILSSTVRIYDSRPGTQPPNVTKGQIGDFATRTIDAKIGDAIPAGATAVLVNLTIVNTTGAGYLGLYQNGIDWPGNSTINWNAPNTLLANSAICALDSQARFAVKANVGFTDFVIDAIGYYR